MIASLETDSPAARSFDPGPWRDEKALALYHQANEHGDQGSDELTHSTGFLLLVTPCRCCGFVVNCKSTVFPFDSCEHR